MPDIQDLARHKLTPSQAAQYWEDGFLFLLDILSADEAAQVRSELEQIERDWMAADLPLPLNTYKRVNSHLVMPLAARLAMDPLILDAVEGVLGPDIMIWSAEFFIKEPRTVQTVGMHQDLTYWGMGETPDQVTAWLACRRQPWKAAAWILSGLVTRTQYFRTMTPIPRPTCCRAGRRLRSKWPRKTKPISNWRPDRCHCTTG